MDTSFIDNVREVLCTERLAKRKCAHPAHILWGKIHPWVTKGEGGV